MPLEQLIDGDPIVGIRPFNQLSIDADIWRQAHDHHHVHRFLHALAVHRPGIVLGLEVVVSPGKPNAVVVAPGVAVDPEGQTVVLREPLQFALNQEGEFYIKLTFQRLADSNSVVQVGGGEQHFRTLEAAEVRCVKDAPGEREIELARIYRANPQEPVLEYAPYQAANGAAVDPFDPKYDQINLLHRRVVFPHCYADGSVGEVQYVAQARGNWKPNRAGLWNLLREGNGRGFHLDFHGPVRWGKGPEPMLLYMAGASDFRPLADNEVEHLARFLDNGGTLVGEACGGSQPFGDQFTKLASSLGAKLEKVGAGHPLLTSHYLFSSPPPGADEKGEMRADTARGVVFSRCNYGAAWQGDVPRPEAADARERIRQAIELGMNLIAFAAGRKRHATLRLLLGAGG